MTQLDEIVAAIKSSNKYKDTAESTIRELTRVEMGRHKKTGQVTKAVRKRLHNIMAPYLGDTDYAVAEDKLRTAFSVGTTGAIREACTDILACHPSTQERLCILDRFYTEIFALTGSPVTILDLACGLNPLTFPWMGLPTTTHFYAYDIHETRIGFLNTYFALQGLPPLAKVQDIAFHPPDETGNVAFLLKELPRIERNYEGLGLALLRALRVTYVVVSFPIVSLHGGRSLAGRYRDFFLRLIREEGWPATEIAFENELVFCVKKEP